MAGALVHKSDNLDLMAFFKRQKLDFVLLEKLKSKVWSLHAVLRDAEEKQFTDDSVNPWLKELKDVSYQADDLLDEIATEALRYRLDAESLIRTSRAMNLISTSPNLGKKVLKSKMNEIDDNIIQAIEKGKSGLTAKGKFSSLSEPNETFMTSSVVDASDVYGRDQDKRTIIELLLSEDVTGGKIGVVAIVGMVGIGKTTLAQLVYNDYKVKEHFDLQAWVYVSHNFNLEMVTKSIVEAICMNSCDMMVMDFKSKLNESLVGKKFLLVLDDVWSEKSSEWEYLLSLLRVGANGSKIVVTTQSERVASSICTVRSNYYLKGLSEVDCLELFANRAFGSKERSSNPKLEAFGRVILKTSQGLPLAAKAPGAILHSKPEVEKWDAILKSRLFDLLDDHGILPALRPSYDHLPHLKRCFAYCSIFPRGYEFEKEKLVLLWMAEGLLQQSNTNKRPEEVGDEYFNYLLSWSFFQQSSGDKSRFTMHDLINGLAQYVSGEFCFRLKDDEISKISDRTRHFSLIRGGFKAFEILEVINDAKFLRTFLPFESPYKHDEFQLRDKLLKGLLSSFQCLRVLCLSQFHITELPDTIDSLKHLRYLDLSHSAVERLSNCKNLKALPEELHMLMSLQSLFINECPELVSFPEGGLPPGLSLLCITSCYKLTPQTTWGLHELEYLSSFEIEGGCSDVVLFPEERLLPSNLNCLRIQRASTPHMS